MTFRSTVGRAIPWPVARQQSLPPFRPASEMYRNAEAANKSKRPTTARAMPAWTKRGGAKRRSFFVLTGGPSRRALGISSCRQKPVCGDV